MIAIREITCKSAIGKCGFPGGGLAINPYVGCEHNCSYCYARFMKRFANHDEKWGGFVDVKTNIAEVLEKQLSKLKSHQETIYIGTVTDPYQPAEEKYGVTRSCLEKLEKYQGEISILTKSNLVLRDLEILKRIAGCKITHMRDCTVGEKSIVNVNFTVNSLDENWISKIEPNAPKVSDRLKAAKKLSESGIDVFAMLGPFWPEFTKVDKLFSEFKKAGIKHVFSESLNTLGANWIGVKEVLRKYYPKLLPKFESAYFNDANFRALHEKAYNEIMDASKKYDIPVTVYFATGHAANKFKEK